MLFAKHDDMSPEISEIRLATSEAVEDAREFAMEGLLGNVPPAVKRIERMDETIV